LRRRRRRSEIEFFGERKKEKKTRLERLLVKREQISYPSDSTNT
jgi:hypothetical protein